MFSLAEFVFICMEEIDELGASELNQIKAMTTQKVVNERMAYAHYKEHRAHIASLCGTTNNVQFLTDLTGNRRWLPFESAASTILIRIPWITRGCTHRRMHFGKAACAIGLRTRR